MNTLIRHLLAILILPVVVTGVVPRWLLAAYRAGDTRWAAAPAAWAGGSLGALLVVAGLALVGWCVTLFARVGRGTLAPWDPTRRLVAVGPYRHVRNPMISGVLAILLGEALVLGSRVLGAWALAFLAFNQVHFLVFEEPGLEHRFGASYREYKDRTPRWIPRL